jgi:hypothetical protein
MEEQQSTSSQLEHELGKIVGDECLRIIIVKYKRLFSVLGICFVMLYALMTCLGKGVEYLLTNEKTRESVQRLLDAFVNKTVTQLTRENYLCLR